MIQVCSQDPKNSKERLRFLGGLGFNVWSLGSRASGMRLVLRVKSVSEEGLLHEGKLKTERKVCLHMILQTADRVCLLLSFRGSGHRVPGVRVLQILSGSC